MSEPHFLVQSSVLVRSSGATLMVRERKEALHGKWTLPGDPVRIGEDPVATAQRAAPGQTGLPVHLSGLIGVYSSVGPDHIIQFVFKGDVSRLPPAPPVPALLEARWITDLEMAGLLASEVLHPEKISRILHHEAQGDLLALARFWRVPASSPQS